MRGLNNHILGREGEEIACGYLKTKGYQIVCRNWNCYAGEIDIVAFFKRLVFVEVKLSQGFCRANENFNQRKKRNLSRTIGIFLLKLGKKIDYQVDLICIDKTKDGNHLSHYQNVLV